MKLTSLFISFEGIDGSGKDTVINSLFPLFYEEPSDPFEVPSSAPSILISKFQNVLRTREPTLNTKAGKKIIEKLRSKTLLKQSKQEVLDIYLEDRKQHSEIIKKYLAEEMIVLCSRYDLSTYAYQGKGENIQKDDIPFMQIFDAHDYKHSTITPDITFYYDIPAEKALERIKNRGYTDEFEKLEMLTSIRKNYLLAIDFLKELQPHRKIYTIDATQSKKSVLEETLMKVQSKVIS